MAQFPLAAPIPTIIASVQILTYVGENVVVGGSIIPHTFLEVTGINGVPYYVGFAPQVTGLVGTGAIFNNAGHDVFNSSQSITLTPAQGALLQQYINSSIATPPYYSIPAGSMCTVWALTGVFYALTGVNIQNPISPTNPLGYELGLAIDYFVNPSSTFRLNLGIQLGRYLENVTGWSSGNNLFSSFITSTSTGTGMTIPGQATVSGASYKLVNNGSGSFALIYSNGVAFVYSNTQQQWFVPDANGDNGVTTYSRNVTGGIAFGDWSVKQIAASGAITSTATLSGTIPTESITLSKDSSNPFITGKNVTTALPSGLTAAQGMALLEATGTPIKFADQTAVDAFGNCYTFTLDLSAATGTAQTIQLTVTGGANNLILTGNDFSFINVDANGNATITVPADQDNIKLTLIDGNTVSTPDQLTLTATLTPSTASGQAITSNTLAVTFNNLNSGAGGTPTQTINGDLNPKLVLDASGNILVDPTTGNVYAKTDSLGNIITDGTAAPNYNDVLLGGTGNDVINAGGGSNVLIGMGGNDTINGGTGNDVIVSGSIFPGDNILSNTFVVYQGSAPGTGMYQNYGGNGNDVINGGGGQDVVIAGNGNNQIYADKQITFAAALDQQAAATASGKKGDLIAVGDGNNTIVGGTGNDAIFTGTGNNTLVCGPGSVTVIGGVETNSAALNWSVSNGIFLSVGSTNAPFTAPTPYNGSLFTGAPVGMGNDSIFGGTGNSSYWLSNGNNWLDAGGGNDYIQAGVGTNTIYGGIGNDTIFGGGGNNYIDLESGSDTVVLNGGNQTVFGGSGDSYIASGDNGSNWAKSDASSTNYIEGGSGNTTIFGSGGNDTLVSGSERGTGKATRIDAGDGNAYIVGGNGSDTILGGAGSNTIEAGDGNTFIQLSPGSGETSTVYGGTGNYQITGGGGTDVIYAGDGNTTIQLNSNPGETSTVYGGNGTDTITGGAGTDVLYAGDGGTTAAPTQVIAGSGTATLYGGAGVDQLFGGSGTDILIAGSGTNTLQGGSGNTTFVAGSGSDTIFGGSGKNTYVFNVGFGQVSLSTYNAYSSDTISFGPGISAADLSLTLAAGDPPLLIQTGDGSSLTINGGMDGAINRFAFSDGSVLTLDQLMAQASTTPNIVAGPNGNAVFSAGGSATLVGGAGNDTLYAWGGNNTLVGGTGNTTFEVHSASDVVAAQSTGSNTNSIFSSVSYVLPANDAAWRIAA